MDNVIEFKEVNYSYKGKVALEKVSFNLKKGDYLGIIGPNGSGKTTLIKILVGLLTPELGSVKLFGKNIKDFNEWQKVGYVAQKAASFDNNYPSSVEEVVSLGLLSEKKFPRFYNKADKEKVLESLKKVGMLEFKNRKIGELSGGQQQRVLIARALVHDPELLVLDEPTVGVDKKTEQNFYKLLRDLNKKENITIIIVSHDISYITKHVNKVACVNRRLLFHGTHEEFCSAGILDEVLGKDKHIVCHDDHRL